MSVSIGVVIVAFDSGALLRSAVESVTSAAKKTPIRVECCVVDNHPLAKDSSISSDVTIYMNSTSNIGFGAACNVGIDLCLNKLACDYVLLLNPDARIREDFFETFLNILSQSDVELSHPISPLILLEEIIYGAKVSTVFKVKNNQVVTFAHGHQNLQFYDKYGKWVGGDSSQNIRVRGDYWVTTKSVEQGIVVHVSNSMNVHDPLYRYLLDFQEFEPLNLINNAGSFISPPYGAGDSNFRELFLGSVFLDKEPRLAWCGAAAILPKKYLDLVGRFDENFFLYYEDTELSLRGDRQNLYPIFYPELVAYHHHSISTSREPALRSIQIWESRAIFVSKSFGRRFMFLVILKIVGKIIKLKLSRESLQRIRFHLLPELKATTRGLLKSI